MISTFEQTNKNTCGDCFYRAMQCTVQSMVSQDVRLSVTCWFSVETAKHIYHHTFSPSCSHTIL